MVLIETVRASNTDLKSLGPGLVAVFVGGTSGLGETTAREFVRNTIAPKVYLIGRNQEQASRIQAELKGINSESVIHFIQSDLSLLKNVDTACAEIRSKENKVNLLFSTTGYLTMAGRNESVEGLDKKFNLNYYSRLRFTDNLLPQLTAAAETGALSRNVSVLSAGKEGPLYLDDLELKRNYSVRTCANHATTMNSLAALHLANLHPQTSFVHIYPGVVKTNVLQGLGLPKWVEKVTLAATTPFAVPIKESGERLLYAATSATFAPKARCVGSIKDAGAYLLHWDDDAASNEKVLGPYREQGVAEKVWNHTLDVFHKVCSEGKP